MMTDGCAAELRHWTVTEAYFPSEVASHLAPNFRPKTGGFTSAQRNDDEKDVLALFAYHTRI